MSSTQSVKVQPVAVPDSMPMQNRRVAVGDHGLGEAEQLIERGGDLVAVGLEARRLVPNERLEVGLVGHAVLRTVDVAEAHGAVGPVLADRCGDIVGQRHKEPCERSRRACRAAGRSRCPAGASFDLHVDLGLPVGGTDVEDGHVVCFSKGVGAPIRPATSWRADRPVMRTAVPASGLVSPPSGAAASAAACASAASASAASMASSAAAARPRPQQERRCRRCQPCRRRSHRRQRRATG